MSRSIHYYVKEGMQMTSKCMLKTVNLTKDLRDPIQSKILKIILKPGKGSEKIVSFLKWL